MKLYINSIADLELCSRNPVNVEKKKRKNLHIRSYIQVIHDSVFFLLIAKQARRNFFYCNSTVHSLVIAMRQNVPVRK